MSQEAQLLKLAQSMCNAFEATAKSLERFTGVLNSAKEALSALPGHVAETVGHTKSLEMAASTEQTFSSVTVQRKSFQMQADAFQGIAWSGSGGSDGFRQMATSANRAAVVVEEVSTQCTVVNSKMEQMQRESSFEKSANAATRLNKETEKAGKAQDKLNNKLKNMVKTVMGLKGGTSVYAGFAKKISNVALAPFDLPKMSTAVQSAMDRGPKSVTGSYTTANQNMQNIAAGGALSMLAAMQPAVDRFNEFLHSAEGSAVIEGISQAFGALGSVAGMVIDVLVSGAQLILDNWGTVAPVLIALAAALGISMVGSAIASMVAWVSATWPLLLIVGIIALIILAINNAGVSFAEMGQVVGEIFGWLYTRIYNVFATIWNVVASFIEFFKNVFNDPVGAVKNLFFDLFDAVLGFVEDTARAIDTLLGTDMATPIMVIRNKVNDWVTENVPENETVVERMQMKDYGETMAAWGEAGANIGKNIDEFSLSGGGLFDSLGSIENTLGGIQSDTSSLNKSVDMSQEDIKSLVDMAEQRYINNINLQTQAPVINVNGQNTGHTVADRQSIADTLTAMLVQQKASNGELSIARTT